MIQRFKYGLVFCLSLFFEFSSHTQLNLVPNPSIEQFVGSCPLSNAIETGEVLNWYNPNSETPDYFNTCWGGVWTFLPFDGNGFFGVSTYGYLSMNFREYVQNELSSPLVSGEYYLIKYYTSLYSYLSNGGSNNVGLLFSDTAILSDTWDSFNIPASVLPFGNPVIMDTNVWQEVVGVYQALGGEQFITLGNTYNDSETTVIPWIGEEVGQAYYVFDDISVTPISSIPGGLPANAGQDQSMEKCTQDSIFIGQKISNLNCNWYILGGPQIASNISGIYVSPEITTTYVVEQILGTEISYETCVVYVNSNFVPDAQFSVDASSGLAPLSVQITNNSTNASDFEWYVNNEFVGTSLNNYTFSNVGSYEIKLIATLDGYSCIDSFAIQINVTEECMVSIPNVFTPNNDGVNDVFSIQSNQDVACEYVILNRWGLEVTSGKVEVLANVPQVIWNGASTPTILSGSATVPNNKDGVYFYRMKVKNDAEEKELEGFVEVVR